MAEMVDYALWYARRGLAVIPLIPHDKYPPMKAWQDCATTDARQIRAWWSKRPDYNIGFITGAKSGGVVVLDLDQKPWEGKYGCDIAQDWQREHGDFPETWEAVTGSGGRHLYFRDVSNPKRHQHLYADSVDFQADGALIVLPPSIHPNGNKYFWDVPPNDTALADIDGNVWAFIKAGGGGEKEKFVSIPEKINTGGRVNTLFKATCYMIQRNFSDRAIRAAIAVENADRCDPPLTADELERDVFPALTRYEKGGGVNDGRRHEYVRPCDITPSF